MGSLLDLTGTTVKVTSSTDKQDIRDAAEVLGIDAFDLQMGMVQSSFTSITIAVYTSAELTENEDAWEEVLSFTAVTSAPDYEVKSQERGFLRYLRWKVKAVTGAGTAHFWIKGVGRRYG